MSRGFLSGGLCPGGFCLGGFCPRTVYEDEYLIQLQFAPRRSLRNGVPLHGKRNFVWQAFFEKRAFELHGMASFY